MMRILLSACDVTVRRCYVDGALMVSRWRVGRWRRHAPGGQSRLFLLQLESWEHWSTADQTPISGETLA